ncbi:MAG: DHA1 family bicyclomycin/chloramphenicol resistance-like MFS transporter, partial [Dinoroseobacter sp.]
MTPIKYLDRTSPPHVTTLVFIAGLGALSLNIFLPSLPGMAIYFDTDYRIVQLSVSLYLLTTAILQVFIGPISDRYGRRVILLWTTSLFLVATVGCLLAPSIEVFLFFRMCQAVVAAGFVISRAAVRDMVGPEQAASMIGYVTMGMSLVPMLAPVLGGALETAFDWRASFLLMLLCGIALLWLIWSDMGETAQNTASTFREQFKQYPELLTSRRFWGYSACAAFLSGAFFAFLGGAPFVGTEVFGLSPTMLGLFFGAPAVGYGIGNFIAGRYSVKLGINRMILIGCILCTIGLIFP